MRFRMTFTPRIAKKRAAPASVGIVFALLLSGAAAFAQSEEISAEETPGERSPEAERIVDEAALRDQGSSLTLLNAPGLSRGVDSIIAEIRKREVEIAGREQRAAERERAVLELEAIIEERAVELDRIRVEIEDRISSWTAQGQDRVLQLASVYASMPPKKAGDLLGRLDLDLAVSVIRGMKKKSSAGVLGAMRPDRALKISQRLLKPLDPSTDVPAAKGR